jgi:hypothetical protein
MTATWFSGGEIPRSLLYHRDGLHSRKSEATGIVELDQRVLPACLGSQGGGALKMVKIDNNVG